MTSEELKGMLSNMTAHRKARQKVANEVINQPELFEPLMNLIYEVNNKESIKAAWVFEIVCEHDLNILVPHIDRFSENLKLVTYDSAVRPLSKVCEFIAKAYTSKKQSLIKDTLTQTHIDAIVEASFDWLIGPYKVASKAYAMSTLFLLGKNSNWIHQELQLIILKDMQKGSPAYCARGKRVLTLLNKNK